MDKFISNFKTAANKKNLHVQDMVAYVVYKTIKAKSENKEVILDHLLARSFTPHKRFEYDALLRAAKNLYWRTQHSKKLMGIPLEELFTPEEVEMFNALLIRARGYRGVQ